jgi:hypothetical protein
MAVLDIDWNPSSISSDTIVQAGTLAATTPDLTDIDNSSHWNQVAAAIAFRTGSTTSAVTDDDFILGSTYAYWQGTINSQRTVCGQAAYPWYDSSVDSDTVLMEEHLDDIRNAIEDSYFNINMASWVDSYRWYGVLRAMDEYWEPTTVTRISVGTTCVAYKNTYDPSSYVLFRSWHITPVKPRYQNASGFLTLNFYGLQADAGTWELEVRSTTVTEVGFGSSDWNNYGSIVGSDTITGTGTTSIDVSLSWAGIIKFMYLANSPKPGTGQLNRARVDYDYGDLFITGMT